jgi:plasmid maintenance system antidote protein VapI
MPDYAFQPAWFSKPGDTLRTLLDRRNLSPVALAQRMGSDTALVHGLLSGKVAIDDNLADLLARYTEGCSDRRDQD